MLQMQSRSMELASNVLQLHQMKQELRSLSFQKCGKVQMEHFETSWMGLYSENLFWYQIFQNSFPDGLNLSLLLDMHSVISIKLRIESSTLLEPLSWSFRLRMEIRQRRLRCISLMGKDAILECITLKNQSKVLDMLALNLLLSSTIHCIWVQRTQFWNDMMGFSKMCLKRFIKLITRRISKQRNSGMNID